MLIVWTWVNGCEEEHSHRLLYGAHDVLCYRLSSKASSITWAVESGVRAGYLHAWRACTVLVSYYSAISALQPIEVPCF